MAARKKTLLVLSTILIVWGGTALYGVQEVVKWIAANQVLSLNSSTTALLDTVECYTTGFAVVPLIVLATGSCSEKLDVGDVGSGISSQHLHFWFLALLPNLVPHHKWNVT